MEKIMRLEKLKLQNYVHFEDFEMVYNDDITHLVALNGSGKTTIGLTAIWAGFKGIAEKSKDALIGERYRFIAPGKKSLDIEITLHDDVKDITIVLKRHITKDVNQISIECTPEDSNISKEYVQDLLNVTFLSASHFTNLSGKDQALALGIDTSDYDSSVATIKSDAQFIRKQIKAIGELPILKKVEMVSITDLNSKRDIIVSDNRVQIDLLQKVNDKKEDIIDIVAKIKAHKEVLSQYEQELKGFAIPKDVQDTSSLDTQISASEETNKLAVVYEANELKIVDKLQLEKDLQKNKKLETEKNVSRLEYIKSAALGMKGLSVDDTGSLLMDDKPIKPPYFSKGELEMIVANIASGLNPEFKVRFIDDFDLLDDENQRKIIKGLTKRGFQIITASVGDKPMLEKSILLRQCKIVK